MYVMYCSNCVIFSASATGSTKSLVSGSQVNPPSKQILEINNQFSQIRYVSNPYAIC